MALIDEVKQYIRVDDDTDDGQIAVLGIQRLTLGWGNPRAEKPLYRLAQMMLVAHWYDNREPTGNATKLAHGLAGIILQLQCEVGDDG